MVPKVRSPKIKVLEGLVLSGGSGGKSVSLSFSACKDLLSPWLWPLITLPLPPLLPLSHCLLSNSEPPASALNDPVTLSSPPE